MSNSTVDLPPSPTPISNAVIDNDQLEEAVERFAALLGLQQSLNGGGSATAGGGGAAPSRAGIGSKNGVVDDTAVIGLSKLLVQDSTSPGGGGGTCSLPSLDLYSGDVPDVLTNNDPFCTTSNDHATNTESEKLTPLDEKTGLGNMPTKKVSIPAMAASVFAVDNTKNASAALGTDPAKADDAAANANANAAKLEQAAALNLGSKMTWTQSSVKLAPSAMLRSLFSSFTSLVDSRVRAWTLLLLRHSLSSGDEGSRSHLFRLLATSNSMDLTTIKTNFRALKLPPEVAASLKKAQVEEEGENTKNSDAVDEPSNDPIEIILPLLFEAVMDLTIQGQQFTSKLRAPGTIKAHFLPNQPLISFLEVDLNTNALVASMVEQARLVVFKVVARATPLASKLAAGQNKNTPPSQFGVKPKLNNNLNLSQLSLLKQNTSKPVEPQAANAIAKKAADEALKEAPKNVPKRAPKKSRSVTWNHPIQSDKVLQRVQTSSNTKQDTKRQRLGVDHRLDVRNHIPHTTSLKSSKSFGRPDASIFESQRNATFAEFGRSHMNNHVPKFGFNGKLSKNHAATSYNLRAPASAMFTSENQNSTFSAASISLSNRLGMPGNRGSINSGARNYALIAGLSVTNQGNKKGMPNSSSTYGDAAQGDSQAMKQLLARTPTALEGLLRAASAQPKLSSSKSHNGHNLSIRPRRSSKEP